MQPDEPCETFTCARCGRTFEKARSDEEAAAEARSLWTPETMADDQAVICDPCFREFMAWAEANAPDLLREPPADPIGDVLRADADAARDEIRASSYGQLHCPSCGKPAGDIIGTAHCLILAGLDRGQKRMAECRDGQPAECATWDDMEAAANISLAEEVRRLETTASAKITGTGPAEFTGLLSILEHP